MLCSLMKQIAGSYRFVLLAYLISAAPTPAPPSSLFPSSPAVPSSTLSVLCLSAKMSIMLVFSQRRHGSWYCSLHPLPTSLACFYFGFPCSPRPRPGLGQTAFRHHRLSTVFCATDPCHPLCLSDSPVGVVIADTPTVAQILTPLLQPLPSKACSAHS